jgi:uncharacterized small protein (DUF1192 family)
MTDRKIERTVTDVALIAACDAARETFIAKTGVRPIGIGLLVITERGPMSADVHSVYSEMSDDQKLAVLHMEIERIRSQRPVMAAQIRADGAFSGADTPDEDLS